MRFYFRNFFYDFNPCVVKRVRIPKDEKLKEEKKIRAISSKLNELAHDLWIIRQNQNNQRNENQFTTLRF